MDYDNIIFEKAVTLMINLCNIAARNYIYKNQIKEESLSKNISNFFENHKNYPEKFWKEVFALPIEQKLILGFRFSEKDDLKMNIPLWIWNLLPEDMYIEDGKRKVKDLNGDDHLGVVFWKA